MNQKFIGRLGKDTNGELGRREFLQKIGMFGASAAAFLTAAENVQAAAEGTKEGDNRLQTENIKYPGATGDVLAYLARPKGDAKVPAVIVIHENRGLLPHFKDVARRFALEGYLAIAPDGLSPLGGTPDDINKAASMIRELDNQATIKNFVAAVQYLKTHPQTTGKVGCMGFCWGGGMTNQVAVNSPDLIAAVPFYGSQPAETDVAKIKASMFCHYAENDQRINAGIEAYEAALRKASIDYGIYIHKGAGHAFFNDTGKAYNKQAAELAWNLTISFFDVKLKGSSPPAK